MSSQPNLLLIGASVRAIAFAALRAGFHPWCADLFGDADLRRHCPTLVLDRGDYPQGFRRLLEQAPQAPWLYTGGLENHPGLVGRLARWRPLWGNGPEVLRAVRSPAAVTAVYRAHHVPHPAVVSGRSALPSSGRWLRKPLRSAGGAGIQHWSLEKPTRPSDHSCYYQEFLEGPSCAALFVGSQGQAQLLGVTRQLVGERWLGAKSFCYCGTIGPLDLPDSLQLVLQKIGTVLAAHFDLQGMFGVDCVLVEGVPYPVEVNPRYPASAEVLELAAGSSLLALHCAAFTQLVPGAAPMPQREPADPMVAKAILFAQTNVLFPSDGPWRDYLQHAPVDLWQPPPLADIPSAGTRIEAGHPVLTVFATGRSEEQCRTGLACRIQSIERQFGW
jgi:predicted ATP-grasp superfamily ATP-dependent carboligase